jgi:hypothetical protein
MNTFPVVIWKRASRFLYILLHLNRKRNKIKISVGFHGTAALWKESTM